ncbi:flagellar basal body L-ring protein FlgH [bacterium]|nr:flagellar basal body L-ring protein FlgH [bacterium]
MIKRILIGFLFIISIISVCNNANAESLFSLSASQNNSVTPKSLFSGARAISIGDIVSIVIEENLTTNDTMAYNSDKASNTVDNFTTFLKKWFSWYDIDSPNNYGGSNHVENSANTLRTLKFGDTISAQVVQQLSNGNLMVQGKKTLVNSNERMDLVVTGIVDPRWIDASGKISSSNVANLQFAVSGRGSVSRGQNEGIINRVIKYLF